MYMKVAVALFAVYFLNVFLGAVTNKPVLNDIFEMLLLIASTLFFVMAILKLEAKSKEQKQ